MGRHLGNYLRGMSIDDDECGFGISHGVNPNPNPKFSPHVAGLYHHIHGVNPNPNPKFSPHAADNYHHSAYRLLGCRLGRECCILTSDLFIQKFA